MQPASSCAKHP